MVITHCKNNLFSLRELVSKLTQDQYVYVSNCLEGGSIGQHLRHVLEFYICLLESRVTGRVNYDRRQRDPSISNNRLFALQRIEEIMEQLNGGILDCSLILEGNFEVNELEVVEATTSLLREFIYCLEHSIHHQALMRVVLQEMGLVHLVNKHFGIASSTVRFHQGFLSQ